MTKPVGTGSLPRRLWAIDAVSAVQDARELSDEHLTFLYPDADELSVTVDIGGLVVGATDGHVIGNPDRMGAWLAAWRSGGSAQAGPTSSSLAISIRPPGSGRRPPLVHGTRPGQRLAVLP